MIIEVPIMAARKPRADAAGAARRDALLGFGMLPHIVKADADALRHAEVWRHAAPMAITIIRGARLPDGFARGARVTCRDINSRSRCHAKPLRIFIYIRTLTDSPLRRGIITKDAARPMNIADEWLISRRLLTWRILYRCCRCAADIIIFNMVAFSAGFHQSRQPPLDMVLALGCHDAQWRCR